MSNLSYIEEKEAGLVGHRLAVAQLAGLRRMQALNLDTPTELVIRNLWDSQKMISVY